MVRHADAEMSVMKENLFLYSQIPRNSRHGVLCRGHMRKLLAYFGSKRRERKARDFTVESSGKARQGSRFRNDSELCYRSCLYLSGTWLWVLRAKEYCFLECKNHPIGEVVRSMGYALVGLHMKATLTQKGSSLLPTAIRYPWEG